MKYLILTSVLLTWFCAGAPAVKEEDVTLRPGETRKILSEKEKIQGTTFSKGTELILNKNGYVNRAVLGDSQKILDEKYSGSFPHIFPAGSIILYHPETNTFGDRSKTPEIPKSIMLRKTAEIMGHSFPPGTVFILNIKNSMIRTNKEYYPNIGVENTFFEIKNEGKVIPAGSNIVFEDQKTVKVRNKDKWE